MIFDTLIDGRPYTFNTEDRSLVIGEGGEAVVMHWTPTPGFIRKHGNRNYLVKLFPDTHNDPVIAKARQQAKITRQKKFRDFRRNLPPNAVMPVDVVYDRTGRIIIGIVLPLIEDAKPLSMLADPDYRKKHRITTHHVLQILINLYHLVIGIHNAGVIIGDFNYKNVLFNLKGEVFLIDLDSAAWGQWQSLVATPEFTDPTLLTASFTLKGGARYSKVSDWYSFTVMVYHLLTFTHPFVDGVHFPVQETGTPIKQMVRFPDRVTKRLSVFDPSIELDPTDEAYGPDTLSDLFRQFMYAVFVLDRRASPFPLQLLTDYPWIKCPRCGREHGRVTCTCGHRGVVPRTPQASPALAKAALSKPKSSKAAPTVSIYLAAAAPNKALQYVVHKDGAYWREDSKVILAKPYDPRLTAHVAGDRTVFCAGPSFVVIGNDGRNPKPYATGYRFRKTTVTANSRHVYWVRNGALVRDDSRRDYVSIGEVGQGTSVWAGERFGVAVTQVGILTRVLTFDAEQIGFTGSCYLPPELRAVVDAQCVLSNDYAWITLSFRKNGKVTNKCYLVTAQGKLQATAEAPEGSSMWLGATPSSALAAGEKLFVPMARTGLVQVGAQGSTLREETVHRGAASVLTDPRTTVGVFLTSQGLVHVGCKSLTPINL